MLHQFLFNLFTDNEEWRLSDGELLHIVERQFPDHVATPKMRRSRIPVWRSKYNTGQLGLDPVTFSFKYLNGVPVNKNEHPLSDAQITELKERWSRKYVSPVSQSNAENLDR